MTAGIIDYKYKKRKTGGRFRDTFCDGTYRIYRRDRDHCSVCGIDRCGYLSME